jgi:hypothetical protein
MRSYVIFMCRHSYGESDGELPSFCFVSSRFIYAETGDRIGTWIAINDGVPPCWYKNCVKWLSECIHHSCSDVDDAFGLCAIARGSGTCTFTGTPTKYFTSSSGFTRNNINLIGKTGPVFFLRVFLLHSLWYCS